MDNQGIREQLALLIEDVCQIKITQPLLDAQRIYQDLHIDSLMMLQLIVSIERKFDVLVPEENVDPFLFETVGSLVGFIERMRDNRG